MNSCLNKFISFQGVAICGEVYIWPVKNELWIYYLVLAILPTQSQIRNSNTILQRNQIEANTDKANKNRRADTSFYELFVSSKNNQNMIATQPKILEIIKKLFEIWLLNLF